MAEQTTTEATVVPSQTPVAAEPDPAQRPARLAMYLGVLLIALGALALYLGYNGTATNALPQAQTPYLISGGLTGLALVALGGVTLAVYVLLRVQADLRTDVQEMKSSIRSLADSLAGQSAFRVQKDAPGANGYVMLTRGSSTYHRPDCRLVTRTTDARPMPKEEAGQAGMTPCRVCTP